MMRLSRLGWAAVFAATLVAVTTSSARAADADKLLPTESDTVVYVNFEQIVKADVVKKYALDQIKQALAGQDAKKLLEEMGLDPMKDIEKVWVGTSGKDQTDLKALVVIHGKFDPDKLFKAAEAATKKDADKFSMIKDGNVTMFKYQPENGNPVYGTVVNETTLVAATDKALIATALKQAETAKKAPLKTELTELIKGLDEKSSVFAVSLVKGKFDAVKFPAQSPIDLSSIEKLLPKMDTMSLVVKVTTDINIEVIFGMKDEDAAAGMGDAVTKLITDIAGFVPALIAFEPKAKPLADVIKTVKSDVKKKNVTVSGKVTGDLIGKIINPDG